MKFTGFSVAGFRRFEKRASVQLVGRLIAFVGPNEAGKTSLLHAMSLVDESIPFSDADKPRRSQLEPRLSWTFELNLEDRAALEAIFDTSGIQRIIKIRTLSGIAWSLEPRNPRRDRAYQPALKASLETITTLLMDGTGVDPEQIESVVEGLRTTEDLDDRVENLQTLTDTCVEVARKLLDESLSVGLAEDEAEKLKRRSEQIQGVADQLDLAVATEADTSPFAKAIAILKPRLPHFYMFTQEDRDLMSAYDLESVAKNPPPALHHLISLAGLDLEQILTAVQQDRRADVSTWRNSANEQLKEVFEQSWNQTGVALQVEIDGSTLLIQATTPGDSGLSSVAERSDGMRWFAALLAYSHGWDGSTVLLADEIETHLHYDAQADLIQVLLNQRFADKIIYTTHSFGCLPPDLGAGVRVVRQLDSGRSGIANGFWAEGSGFSPLLASMGAATVSFTPSRRAVIAEGASDAVLLPTLLRQANELDYLAYQVVPGLSAVAESSARSLEEEAGRTFFLTDSDTGGERLRKKLRKAGIDDSSIFELGPGEDCVLEDLVDFQLYADAVNEEIAFWQDTERRIGAEQFKGKRLRPRIVERWCTRHSLAVPSKVAVAQRLADSALSRQVLDQSMAPALRRLHKAWSP